MKNDLPIYFLPLLIIFLALSCSPNKQGKSHLLVVSTGQGYVKGQFNKDSTVRVFKGIPYAQPPVGENRWRAPQPIVAGADTLDAYHFGASPVQNTPVPFSMWSEEFIAPAEPLSEDCLYLNVWAPTEKSEKGHPVLVWIHGGAFVSGSSACDIYDGEELAKRGVVFVSINYRLGIFGFMAHPDLSRESTVNASGNYALMDQLAALRWVKENITAWGGDTSRVTVSGQSAGAASVEALMLTKYAPGLFQQAIIQSGNLFGKELAYLSEAEMQGLKISKMAGYKNLEQLRKMPADSLLLLANQLPFGTWQPIVDKFFIKQQPAKMLASGNIHDVPILSGWVTMDSRLSGLGINDQEDLEGFMKERFQGKEEEFQKLFPSGEPEQLKGSANKVSLMQFKVNDDLFMPSVLKNDVFLYEFAFVPTDKPGFTNYGAFHTADVPYTMHNLHLWNRPWKERDREMENALTEYWVNFLKTGNPNGEGLPEWKAYGKKGYPVMYFDDTISEKEGLYREEYKLWRSVQR